MRLRFAPSPTGPLHIGGVRTALFNYLWAKKNNGQFILRIEDTDQTRYVKGAEEYIVEALEWLGVKFDESINVGGKFGPYKQSERREIYKGHIQTLLNNGAAYYAFDTAEELEKMRTRLQEQKSSVQHYNFATRGDMKNSFTLTEEEVKQKIENGDPFVVRFNMPQDRQLVLQDIIRGDVKVNTSTLDDKVLFKSDGLPTYHLANIVDDHLMEISHVIRGEEWLPSMPLHILLYEAFGWSAPEFAHLPLILKPNGKGKLSKRDGDKLGFPVFPIEWTDPKTDEKSSGYREAGYSPEAVVNMLAFLGWNPGTEQEVFSIDKLISTFDISKVQKGGAKFDPDKTKWFNQQHLRLADPKDLAKNLLEKFTAKNINPNIDTVIKVIDLVKERATFEADLYDLTSFFFIAPTEYNPKASKKNWKEPTPELIQKSIDFLSSIDDFTSENLEEKFIAWIQEQEVGLGKILNPVRLLIVGNTTGPHLFDILEIVGKDEVEKRLTDGLSYFNNQ